MSPLLHHARVHAEWASRRPLSSGLAAFWLGTGVLMPSAFPSGLQHVGAQLLVVSCVAVAMGVAAVLAGALAGPSRKRQAQFERGPVHRMLPLGPLPRVWAEILGHLAVVVPLLLSGAWLLRWPDPAAAEFLSRFRGQLLAGLPEGLALMLPALLLSRRISTFGQPAALGPLAVAGLVTFPGALASGLGLGIPVALFTALLAPLAVAPSEAAVVRLQTLLDGQQREVGLVEVPWHRRRGATLLRGWRELAPALLGAMLPALLLLVVPAPGVRLSLEGFQRVAPWLLVGPVALLLSGPILVPLGLNARVALPGRSVPTFDPAFRRAWQLLPVDEAELRGAALVQARLGALALLGLGALTWGLGTWDEMLSPWPALLLAAGLLASSPLFVALALGTARHRAAANLLAGLLFCAAMSAAIGPALGAMPFAVHLGAAVLVGCACVLSVGLQWSMVRVAEPAKP